MPTNIVPAHPLHNHDIISVYLNHFHCMRNCAILVRALIDAANVHVY